MSIGMALVVVFLLLLACWACNVYMPEPFKTPSLAVCVIILVGFIITLAFPGLFAHAVR